MHARVIAEAFEVLKSRDPHMPDLTARENMSETKSRLLKGSEQVRAELKETKLKLTREIPRLRRHGTRPRAPAHQRPAMVVRLLANPVRGHHDPAVAALATRGVVNLTKGSWEASDCLLCTSLD